MYKNIRHYNLRYTDVDAYDNLKLSSLLSFMEESACSSADELGFGYSALTPKGLGFIIVSCYIKLYRNIKLGETVTIHTWPLKPRLMIFLRDSEIYVGDEKVGVGTTRWLMVNMNTFAPVPSSAFFKESDFENYNTNRSIDFSDWKIPLINNDEVRYSKTVHNSDYDHYFHMNNTKYADCLMDVFSNEEIKNKTISSAQISYVKQCKEGERIDFYREFNEGLYIIEGKVGEELRVQMRIKFNES